MGLFHGGRIFRFGSVTDLINFTPFDWVTKLRFLLTSSFLGTLANWRHYEHISASSWLIKYAGKKVFSTIWKPLLEVKFGKFAEAIPLSWLIGRMRQRLKSRRGTNEKLGYLDGSLKILLDRLLERLTDMQVELVNSAKVHEILTSNAEVIGVKTNKGAYLGNKTLMTIPCPHIASMVKSLDEVLADRLQTIQYFGAICVVLQLSRKLGDIYWLNVAESGFHFGGVIEHTNFIPAEKYEGTHLIYLSRYFTADESIATWSEADIKDRMLTQLKVIYADFDPESVKQIFVFKAPYAATYCHLDFSQSIVPVNTSLKNFFIANMMHVYPDERSLNNACKVAANACQVMNMGGSQLPQGMSLAGQIGF